MKISTRKRLAALVTMGGDAGGNAGRLRRKFIRTVRNHRRRYCYRSSGRPDHRRSDHCGSDNGSRQCPGQTGNQHMALFWN